MATVVLQAVFHACGDRDEKPGTGTLSRREVVDALAVAQGMRLAMAAPKSTPPSKFRAQGKGLGMIAARAAVEMHGEGADILAEQLRQIGMTVTRAH